jgi:hypothetical protein
MAKVPLADLRHELQRWSRDHRRNEVARILAALDLLTGEQIYAWSLRVGLNLRYTTNRKQLLEAIRRELVK